jgi:ribonuclease VapC
MVALDASALIALVLREPGHDRVSARLAGACISSVNLVEVLARFIRDGIDVDEASGSIEALGIEHVALGPDDAPEVAMLIGASRAAGLSLGDCACLALARARGIPAMTTDRAWTRLDLGVEIELIR